jgi:trehalose 6-phosphate phosphatase
MIHDVQDVLKRIYKSSETWLFLDYDGTLAEFEPTPGIINPDPDLAQLLSDLVGCHRLNIAIISGRRLEDLQKLLPVKGLWLAGTYGMEWITPRGERILQGEATNLRSFILKVKKKWAAILDDHSEFYLEDKGLALAIHAKNAEADLAERILKDAHRSFDQMSGNLSDIRIISDKKFLEIAPLRADKGKAISWLLKKTSADKALLLYVGDDDRDEIAFKEIHKYGGIALVVSSSPRQSEADYYFQAPKDVRKWLREIILMSYKQ